MRPVMHVPNAANVQMSATAAAAQSNYDNRSGVSDWVPMLIILGAFVGAMIFILSDDNGGHIRFGISPD
jgi:hypothetical protein